jgi:hypothetical protein
VEETAMKVVVLNEQMTAESKYCFLLGLWFGDDVRVCTLFRRIRKIGGKNNYYSLRHVCLFIRMEQLATHWTDFR